MLTKITKSCSVRLNGTVKELKAGEILTLPLEKSKRLIAAGYGQEIKPDIEECRRLALELSERDPKGGCWDWIIKNRPEMWQASTEAFLSDDIAALRQIFDEMVDEWNKHGSNPSQPLPSECHRHS